MLFLDNVCEISDVLKVIYFIKQLLKIVLIIIPILLIVMVSIDFIKAALSNESDMKKSASMAVKRIISAVALFLVPTFVNFTMQLLGNLGVNFSSCYNSATISGIADATRTSSTINEIITSASANYSGTTTVNLAGGSSNVVTSGNYTKNGGKGKATEITIEYNKKDDEGRCGKSLCASIATVKYPGGTVKYYMGRQDQQGVDSGQSCRINSFMAATNAVTDGKNSSADLYKYLLSLGYSGDNGDANLTYRTFKIAGKKYNVSNQMKVYYGGTSKSKTETLMKEALDNGQPVMIFVWKSLCPDLASSHHALLLLGYDKNDKVVFIDSGNKALNSSYKKRTVKEMAKCLSDDGTSSYYYRMVIFKFK